MSKEERRKMVDREHPILSIVGQCALLGVNRSSLYYRPKEASAEELSLMKEMEEVYLATPFYGSRRMKAELNGQGILVSRKRIQRLMGLMGLHALYRRPRTSGGAKGDKIYPYLLRDVRVTRPNQVWVLDITHVPMARGFLYLVAVMDYYSRYVLAWRLSNTLEADFCVEALMDALGQGRPQIFNTDRGSQFTSQEFTQLLRQRGVKISMDGKGRYQDNILAERLWRTVKYEEVHLKAYDNAAIARRELGAYFRFYNNQRPHQTLGYRTPASLFHTDQIAPQKESKGRRFSIRPILVSCAGAAGSSLKSTPILSNYWGSPQYTPCQN